MSTGLKRENEHLCGEIVKLRADLKTANDLLRLASDALGDLVCDGCGHRIGWNGEHDGEQTRLERSNWRKCNHCKHARTALAAISAHLNPQCPMHRSFNGCELPVGHEGAHKSGGLTWGDGTVQVGRTEKKEFDEV